MPTIDEDYPDNVDLKSCSDVFRLAGSFDGKLALSLLDQLDLLPALYAECWYPKPFSMKCLWLGSASLGPSPCKVLIGLRA